jgi:hypothetical protein
MAETTSLRAQDSADMKKMMQQYASKGYSTIHQDANSVTLSRKKPFNWVLAIVCLFIPIIGWIALIFMLFAAGRGSQVVEISVS